MCPCTLPDSKRHWRLTPEHRRRLIFSLNWGDVVGFTSHLWFKNSKQRNRKEKTKTIHTRFVRRPKEWWMNGVTRTTQTIIYFKMHFWLWRGAPIISSRNYYMTRCLWTIKIMEKWRNANISYRMMHAFESRSKKSILLLIFSFKKKKTSYRFGDWEKITHWNEWLNK